MSNELINWLQTRFRGTITSTNKSSPSKMNYIPVNDFKFHDPWDVETTNGLYLSNVYIPEEVIMSILSYVPPKDLLALTLVCKKWCNLIKSDSLWIDIYNRQHPRKAKNLPWYVYYCYFTTDNFSNLIKNGNGQEQFKHWRILKNFGDEFKIENPPAGSDPLPLNVPEFYGHTGCFATSFYECLKVQEISLTNKRLLRYIMYKFMPQIYVSEWMAGRFDCGCYYKLGIRGVGPKCEKEVSSKTSSSSNYEDDEEVEETSLFQMSEEHYIEQWKGKEWQKVSILIEGYPADVDSLVFEHEGRDTQFWKGHYGSKMAGGVLRFVFDSIGPLEDTGVTEARRLFNQKNPKV